MSIQEYIATQKRFAELEYQIRILGERLDEFESLVPRKAKKPVAVDEAACAKDSVEARVARDPHALREADVIAESKRITKDELKSIVASELQNALGIDGGQLSSDRKALFDAYAGRPYGDEQEGRSSVVTRSCYEVVESLLPVLVRLFVQHDRVVEFEPYTESEEAMAEQATQIVNYTIMRDSPFFSICVDWFKEALISRNAYIRVFWDEQRTCSTSTYTGLNDDEYRAVTDSDDCEILEETSYPNPNNPYTAVIEDTPQIGPPMLHDVRVKVYRNEGRVKIENVPNECVLVSRFAPRVVLDGNHFVAIKSQKRVSDLREMGYDDDLILEAAGSSEDEFNSERLDRFQDDDTAFTDTRTDEAMKEVWIEESWIKADMDGDGVAELIRVVSANDASIVFEVAPADEVPVISLCPIPIPNKHVGMSVCDTVADLQRISTVLTRQVLDNLYLTNAPRFLVDEMAMGDDSYDDILQIRPGGIVRVTNIEGVKPLQVEFVAAATLPVLQYVEQLQEFRSGVSRHQQGLSPDDLNRHTATGLSLLQEAASQRVELIARIFAETGVKQLGQRVLSLLVRHQQQARTIRLTNKRWVEYDVKNFRENMEVSCAVGLGTGNRDGTMQHLMQILQIQQQIAAQQGGVNGPLVTAQDVFSVLSKLTASAGWPGQFFSDPSQMPPQPPQPNPAMVKAQIDAQATAAKTQSQIASDQAKTKNDLLLEQQRAAHSMQIEAMKSQHQLQLQREREQAKAEIALLHQQNTVEKTTVTKHDANGRILEFVKQNVPMNSGGD